MKKFKKFLNQNLSPKEFAQYSLVVFPFLWALAMTFGLIEAYTHYEFFSKRILIGARPLTYFAFITGIIFKAYQMQAKDELKISENFRILAVINKLSFIPLLVITFVLNVIELSKYSNYVFSSYHVQPQNLYWPCYLSAFLVLLDSVKTIRKGKELIIKVFFIEVKPFWGKRLSLEKLFLIALFSGLLLSTTQFNIFKNGRAIGENLLFLLKNPLASYDEKMFHFWGDYYNYMVFVRENTPEDAVIIVPAQRAPWLITGNRALDKYFLYPREIIHNKGDPYAPIDSRADYITLVWGYWSRMEEDAWYGWPKEKIPAEWIIYKKKDSTEIEKEIEDTVYVPEDEINNEANGLIKVKKE